MKPKSKSARGQVRSSGSAAGRRGRAPAAKPPRPPHDIALIEPSPPPQRPALPERILFAYPSLFFHALQETLGAGEVTPSRIGLGRVLVKAKGESRVAVVRGALGAPAGTIVLEDAIAAGAREIIVFSSAIAVSPQVGIGDTVVPTEAVSGEGTSAYYLPRGARRTADAVLRHTLLGLLDRAGVRHRAGRVGTTDAYYRQTPERIRAYRKARLLAIDMDVAALFAVARKRGVRIAALLVASESLAGEAWEQGSDRPAYLNAVVGAAAALAAWAFPPSEAER